MYKHTYGMIVIKGGNAQEGKARTEHLDPCMAPAQGSTKGT